MVTDLAGRMTEQYRRRTASPYRSQEVHDLVMHEWRATVRAMLTTELPSFGQTTLLDVGASIGHNVPHWRFLGFGGIVLNDIRPEVAPAAERWGVPFVVGDAATLTETVADVVYAGTLFSSILELEDRTHVANGLWRAARRGVLIYDFTVTNPSNRDVRRLTDDGVTLLFPQPTRVAKRCLTLAPPIARRIPAWLYPYLNVRALQTHRMWWLPKDSADETRVSTCSSIR